MPLTPQYTWSETESSLEVAVDVPGVSRNKADVFATDAFLKINCPPYLFALDLYKDVDDSRSSATIIPQGVVFKLFKREPGVWGRLAAEGDKAALTQRRNASIDRAYRALEEARQARLARKQQEDKAATQRSMDVDRRKRQEVERRKAEELAEERGRLQEWQAGLKEQADAESDYEDEPDDTAAPSRTSTTADSEAPAPDHPDYHGRGWRPPKPPREQQKEGGGGRNGTEAAGTRGAQRPGAGDDDDDDDDDEKEEDDRGGRRRRSGSSDENDGGGGSGAVGPGPARPVSFKPLPPPRATLAPVQVNFTKLETGHLPAREQREEEIRAFRKQARSQAADPDAVDIAERQPLFLKDKGDELFRAGNYNGAFNAYSRAISLDDSLPAVRSNRAACLLALGDAAGCVADCDRAMELLTERRDRLDRDMLDPEEAAALRRQLVRLLVRRAQGRTALLTGAAGRGGGGGGGGGTVAAEQLQGALRDYEAAMRLAPSDPSLEADYQELLAALQPADAAALRQRGDARFRSGDYEGAAEAFSALLSLPRSRVAESERLAAFSNRAACQLVLERYAAAVADCDAGLALLLPPAAVAVAGSAGAGAGLVHDFGTAAGQEGLVRLTAWARTLRLPGDKEATAAGTPAEVAEPDAVDTAAARGSGGTGGGAGGCGLAPAAAAAAAARLLSRRGGAAAHLQRFADAAADYRTAAELLRRLGEGAKADAAQADAERMVALAEGREALPPRPLEAVIAAAPVAVDSATMPQSSDSVSQQPLLVAGGEAKGRGEGASSSTGHLPGECERDGDGEAGSTVIHGTGLTHGSAEAEAARAGDTRELAGERLGTGAGGGPDTAGSGAGVPDLPGADGSEPSEGPEGGVGAAAGQGGQGGQGQTDEGRCEGGAQVASLLDDVDD